MPLARIRTVDPDSVADLAAELREAGFQFEFAHPDERCSDRADVEIRADRLPTQQAFDRAYQMNTTGTPIFVAPGLLEPSEPARHSETSQSQTGKSPANGTGATLESEGFSAKPAFELPESIPYSQSMDLSFQDVPSRSVSERSAEKRSFFSEGLGNVRDVISGTVMRFRQRQLERASRRSEESAARAEQVAALRQKQLDELAAQRETERRRREELQAELERERVLREQRELELKRQHERAAALQRERDAFEQQQREVEEARQRQLQLEREKARELQAQQQHERELAQQRERELMQKREQEIAQQRERESAQQREARHDEQKEAHEPELVANSEEQIQRQSVEVISADHLKSSAEGGQSLDTNPEIENSSVMKSNQAESSTVVPFPLESSPSANADNEFPEVDWRRDQPRPTTFPRIFPMSRQQAFRFAAVAAVVFTVFAMVLWGAIVGRRPADPLNLGHRAAPDVQQNVPFGAAFAAPRSPQPAAASSITPKTNVAAPAKSAKAKSATTRTARKPSSKRSRREATNRHKTRSSTAKKTTANRNGVRQYSDLR